MATALSAAVVDKTRHCGRVHSNVEYHRVIQPRIGAYLACEVKQGSITALGFRKLM